MKNAKKVFLIIVFFLFFLSLKAQEYLVSQIDSATSKYFYIIRVKNEKRGFEGVVLSEKKRCEEKQNRIIVGNQYPLKLKEHDMLPMINHHSRRSSFYKEIQGIYFMDINVCKLAEYCVVYQAENLCGLYLKLSVKK